MTSAVHLEESIPKSQKVQAADAELRNVKASYNPYLAARREWDERYGSLISRERKWRIMAFLSSLVALLAVGGMVRLSTKSHIVPFVVAMDSLGRTVAAGSAEETSPSDDRLKRATLFNWVEDLRTVTNDESPSERPLTAFTPIASGGQAQAFISEFTEPIRHKNAPRQKPLASKSVRSCRLANGRSRWSGSKMTRDLYGAVKGRTTGKPLSASQSIPRLTSGWPGSIPSEFTSRTPVGAKFSKDERIFQCASSNRLQSPRHSPSD